MLLSAHMQPAVWVSLSSTDSLWQPGGVREGEEGQWEGKAYLHEKSSSGQWAEWIKGTSGSNRKWRVGLHTPPSFPQAERERGRSRRGERGKSKWAKQRSHSWCVRSQSGRMCRDPLDYWKQDWTRQKKREGGQKDIGQKEGRRVEEEVWRTFQIFWDLFSAKDLFAKVCHRGWATALPWS